MTTALIVGGLLLVGLGLVASQLFRLKDWLARQPLPADEAAEPEDPGPPPKFSAPSPGPTGSC